MRNAYRGSAKMYAADERVLGWAKELLVSGAALPACKSPPRPRFGRAAVRPPRACLAAGLPACRLLFACRNINHHGDVDAAGKWGSAAAGTHPAGVCAHAAHA